MTVAKKTTATAATRAETRVWLDDAVLPAGAAALSVTDHGVIVGDGVFEALKVTTAGPFALTRHLDRLTRSAAALSLPAPDHALVRRAVDAVLADRPWTLGRLRITYTGGEGPLGSQEPYGPARLLVAAEPMAPPEPICRIVTTPWLRNADGALTGVKSTSYAENVRGLRYAHEHGAEEGIFVNTRGQVCEGTGTNIFFVFGDEIVTPTLAAGPLAGITRGLLLDWTSVVERDLGIDQARRADEVFVTSSLRDVQAVQRWDDRDYPAPGPVTRRAAAIFAERCLADPDPR